MTAAGWSVAATVSVAVGGFWLLVVGVTVGVGVWRQITGTR